MFNKALFFFLNKVPKLYKCHAFFPIIMVNHQRQTANLLDCSLSFIWQNFGVKRAFGDCMQQTLIMKLLGGEFFFLQKVFVFMIIYELFTIVPPLWLYISWMRSSVWWFSTKSVQIFLTVYVHEVQVIVMACMKV